MKKETNDVLTITMGLILALIVIVGTATTGFLIIRVTDLSKEVKNLKTYAVEPTEEIPEEEQPSGYDTSKFKEIAGKDVVKESKDKTIVVLIARQTCGYCVMYAPVITKVSEDYDFTVRYVDLEKMVDIYTPNWDPIDKESLDTLSNLPAASGYETFMDELGATPMTVVIKNGKIIGGVVGYVDENTLINKLKDSGFIK